MADSKRKPQPPRMSVPGHFGGPRRKSQGFASTQQGVGLHLSGWLRRSTLGCGMLLGSVACQSSATHTRGAAALQMAKVAPLPVLQVGEPEVLNRNDFVYALAFSKNTTQVSYVHHVLENMEVSFWNISNLPPSLVSRAPINHHEYDVEDIAFIPDREEGAALATSRQGRVTFHRSDEPQPSAVYVDGQPLTRVSVTPSGELAAIANTAGRVVLLSLPHLRFRGETQVHQGAIQGLSFLNETELLSAGEDQTLVLSRVVPDLPTQHQLNASLLADGSLVALAHVDGNAAIATTFRPAQPHTFITANAVRRLKVPIASALPFRQVTLPSNDSSMPVVELRDVQLRYFSLGNIAASVCDACVPVGAELTLGADALHGLSVILDIAEDRIQIAPVQGGSPDALVPARPSPIEAPLALSVEKTLRLPGPATDLDIDEGGRTAVVSFSHAPARRSPELYQAEKAGIYPPPSPVSGAMVVELGTFSPGKRLIGHRGFTVTTAISPDGHFVATGGWDERVLIFDATSGKIVFEDKLGWLVRRVRFAPNGQLLGVAAWTHPGSFGENTSSPSMLLYPTRRIDPRLP